MQSTRQSETIFYNIGAFFRYRSDMRRLNLCPPATIPKVET